MSNKRCTKARLQYLRRGYKASEEQCEETSRAACFALLYIDKYAFTGTFHFVSSVVR